MCRQMRLAALLHNVDNPKGALGKLHNILSTGQREISSLDKDLSTIELGLFLSKAPRLEQTEYAVLFQYLNQTGRPCRVYTDIPHPENAVVLPPTAKQLREFVVKSITYSCYSSHPGNSSIQFYDWFTQSNRTGCIRKIFQIPLKNRLHIFFLIEEHSFLPPEEEQKAPYLICPQLKSKIVAATPSARFYIIEPIHIITHLTTLPLTEGAFGIPDKTHIICWALNRGKQWS